MVFPEAFSVLRLDLRILRGCLLFMLLAIDVGNTNIVLGVFEGAKLVATAGGY